MQATVRQFLQENVLRDDLKGFTEEQVDYIHSPSLIHYSCHLVVEGDQIDQAGSAFPNPTLAGPDPLVDQHVPCDDTQDDLFHELPWLTAL